MPVAVSLAPLSLVAVLVLSGLAKLRDPSATASMIQVLKLPMALRHRIIPRALPWVELATAALLLTPWRWMYAVGAVSATGLFVTFLLIIARAMTFRPRPTCGCFGRVGDHRVSGRTVLRNTLFVTLAMISLGIAGVGDSAGSLIARYSIGDWVWVVFAMALAATAVFVLGRPAGSDDGEDLSSGRPDGADAGSGAGVRRVAVPAGVVVDADLRPSSLAALTRAQPQVLVLVNCWCGSTYAAIQRLPGWRRRIPHLGMPLVHTRAPWDEPRLSELPDVLWDPGSQLYSALEAGSSPSAVLLGKGGNVLAGPVSGIEAIEALVEGLSEGDTGSPR